MLSVYRHTQVYYGCLQDWGQHIMHTEQAMRKASPVHATSPEHTLPEKPPISPAHRVSPFSAPWRMTGSLHCAGPAVNLLIAHGKAKVSGWYLLAAGRARECDGAVGDPSRVSLVSEGSCNLDQSDVCAGASMSPHHASTTVQDSRKTSVRSPLHPQGVPLLPIPVKNVQLRPGDAEQAMPSPCFFPTASSFTSATACHEDFRVARCVSRAARQLKHLPHGAL